MPNKKASNICLIDWGMLIVEDMYKKIAAEMVIKRNVEMQQKIEAGIDNLKSQFPSLKGKLGLKIVVALGVGHTEIAKNMAKKKDKRIKISKDYFPSLQIFSLSDELIRKISFGREAPASGDVIYARAWLSDILQYAIGLYMYRHRISIDPILVPGVIRKISNQLSLEEIKTIWEHLATSEAPYGSVLDFIIANHPKIHIPIDNDEAARMVGIYDSNYHRNYD